MRSIPSSLRVSLFVVLATVVGLGCSINPIPTPHSGAGDHTDDIVSWPSVDAGGGVDTSLPGPDIVVADDVSLPRDAVADAPSFVDVSEDVPVFLDGEVLDGEVTGGCQPLDDETLEALVLSLDASVDMMPGDDRAFGLGTVECCVWVEPVDDICVVWSVWPERAGASIDPETGLLHIHENTPHGTVFTVTADVEDGRRSLSIDVHVYTELGNPLVGFWTESAQLDCADGAALAVEDDLRVGELRFRASGDVLVTWSPFEVYVDYWGRYTYDLDSGRLVIEEVDGNYVPEDLDGEGHFSFTEEGELVLEDLWLGSPQTEEPVTGRCGHIFVR